MALKFKVDRPTVGLSIKRAKLHTSFCVGRLAARIVYRLNERTPKDTTLASKSWIAKEGAPTGRGVFVDLKKPPATPSFMSSIQQSAAIAIQSKQSLRTPIIIEGRVSYLNSLNTGETYTTQAEPLFVENSVFEAIEIHERAERALRGRPVRGPIIVFQFT